LKLFFRKLPNYIAWLVADTCRNIAVCPLSQATTLLTNDVARILDVSPQTVRLWERQGRLPALKTERGTPTR
jgi:DNA-binding transcriptional regulator YiaG